MDRHAGQLTWQRLNCTLNADVESTHSASNSAIEKEPGRLFHLLALFVLMLGILLPLPGSAQCNGINPAIISKEQSIL